MSEPKPDSGIFIKRLLEGEERGMVPVSALPIVTAPMDVAKMKEHFDKIQELKRSLIDPRSDTVKIAEKTYILKSGWRKLAFAFNLKDEIIKEYKEEIEKEDEETKEKYKATVWHMWVKVTAPNGREAIGIAAASSDEREFAHDEHDPYALCHTRAKNRAISDILGLGEVSGEEMRPTRPRVVVPKPLEVPKEEKVEMVLVRILQPVNEFVGKDLKVYGPYKVEDVATIPRVNALGLIQAHAAMDISLTKAPAAMPPVAEAKPEKAGEFPLSDTKTGKTYGNIKKTENGMEISFDPSIDMAKTGSAGPVQNFLYSRVLDTMKAKVESEGGYFNYEPDMEGTVLRGIIITGEVNESRFKELRSATTWAAARAAEWLFY